jgi:arsenite methyltransferase
VIEGVGFRDLRFGDPVDTYGGAPGEANARTFGVQGFPFTASKPERPA